MAPFEFELGFDDVGRATLKQRKTKATRAFSQAFTGIQASPSNSRAVAAANDGETGEKVKSEVIMTARTPPSRGKKRPFSSIVESNSAPELSVGFDWGMAYTGIAQASTRAGPSAVKVMQKWPGTLEVRDKVPSLLALKAENVTMLFDEKSKAGYEVSSIMNRRGYLKYAMDDGAPAAKYDDPILEADVGRLMLRTPSGENTMEHAVEYLRNIYNLYIAELKANTPPAFFERLRLFWTITHPVACSEQGKSNTLEAMKAAGIGSRKHDKIRLTSEAEAAIVAAFAYAQGCYGPNTFGVKTNVTMLDIGGLTQDSATFFVKAGDPHLKLDQVCVSEGGKCGGVTIFCRFYTLCTKWFGTTFTDLPQNQIGAGSKFDKDFESEIRRFDGKNLNKYARIPLALDIEDQDRYRMGEIVFDGYTMKECIDPLLVYSTNVLREQLSTAEAGNSKEVSTVVLGGGLALCPYIEARLRDFCKQQTKHSIELVRPEAAWSLVARGAVIRGLKTNIVEGRRSRAWYGVAGHRRLDADEDEEDADFEDPINGSRVSGAMKWHVKKSERIAADTPAKIVKAYIVLSEEQMEQLEDINGIISIYKYEGDEEQAPTSVDHREVHKIGNINIDLSEMSTYARKAIKEAYEASDDADQQLRITIEQNVNADSGLIEFTAKVGKTKIGKYILQHATLIGSSAF